MLGTYVIRDNVKDLSGNSAVAAERTVVVAVRTGGGGGAVLLAHYGYIADNTIVFGQVADRTASWE